MKRIAHGVIGLVLLSGAAGATTLQGVWQTEPDAKQTTGYVQIVPCGATLCGTVIQAFDKQGRVITTPSVGRRVLWDVREKGGAGEGRVYVPIMRADFPVRLEARGRSLNLKACNTLGICKTQVWNRVK